MDNQSSQHWNKRIAWRYSRYLIPLLVLVQIGFLWWLLATPMPPGAIFGRYSNRIFLLLVAASYVSAWIPYIALSQPKLKVKLANFILTTSSFSLLLGLLEVPALVGLLDYRLLIGPPPSARFTQIKAWENPANLLDPELIHIHRPNQEVVGEAVGDLVHFLGISNAQPYEMDVRYDRNGPGFIPSLYPSLCLVIENQGKGTS